MGRCIHEVICRQTHVILGVIATLHQRTEARGYQHDKTMEDGSQDNAVDKSTSFDDRHQLSAATGCQRNSHT